VRVNGSMEIAIEAVKIRATPISDCENNLRNG
jgi:hypothetical protein